MPPRLGPRPSSAKKKGSAKASLQRMTMLRSRKLTAPIWANFENSGLRRKQRRPAIRSSSPSGRARRSDEAQPPARRTTGTEAIDKHRRSQDEHQLGRRILASTRRDCMIPASLITLVQRAVSACPPTRPADDTRQHARALRGSSLSAKSPARLSHSERSRARTAESLVDAASGNSVADAYKEYDKISENAWRAGK